MCEKVDTHTHIQSVKSVNSVVQILKKRIRLFSKTLRADGHALYLHRLTGWPPHTCGHRALELWCNEKLTLYFYLTDLDVYLTATCG